MTDQSGLEDVDTADLTALSPAFWEREMVVMSAFVAVSSHEGQNTAALDKTY